MLKRTIKIGWYLGAVLLLLAAIGLTTARFLVPALSAYKQEIELTAGRLLEREVVIGEMRAGMHGLVPVVKLKHVALFDPSTSEQLDVREIWLGLDVKHYIAEREWRLAGIDVVGVDLVIVRAPDGEIYIEMLRYQEPGSFDLSALEKITINEASITVDDRLSGEPPRRFREVELTLHNRGDRRLVTGHALPPTDIAQRIDIEAAFEGELVKPEDWQGTVYLRGQMLNLAVLSGDRLPGGYQLEGRGDARLWIGFNGKTADYVSGELDMHDIGLLPPTADGEPYRFDADAIAGRFGWRAVNGGWQFAVQEFSVTREARTWYTENLSLSGILSGEVDYYRGVSERINLDGLNALLPIVPGLDDETRARFAALEPRGVIKDLAFLVSQSGDDVALAGFSAQFAGIGIGRHGRFPGVEGLDGRVSGSLEEGIVHLESRNAVVFDESLFREDLPVDQAEGDIRWFATDTGVEISTHDLVVTNDDFRLDIHFALDVSPASPPSLSLGIEIPRAKLGRVSHYLPAGVMPADGVAWLDGSLLRGKIADGSIVVNGRLDELPFDHGEGVLEVVLPVTDAVLDFTSGWTPITQLDAQVLFTGRRMDVHTSRGLIRSAALQGVHAVIPDLANPRLQVRGDIRGPLPVMLAELGSSPLGETYGGFVDRVRTSGDAELALDLAVDLSKADKPVEISGLITLLGNDLQVKESSVSLAGIDGELAFDEAGIRGDVLKADLLGTTGRARVRTLPGESGTRISLLGRFDILGELLPQGSPLTKVVRGKSEWNVELALRGIPKRGEPANVGLEIKTDMVGIAVDLPAPLGKTANESRQLVITADRIDFPEKKAAFNYGNRARGVLLFAGDEQGFSLNRGHILVGEGQPEAPENEKLRVSVVQDRLVLADWQPYFGNGGGADMPVTVDLSLGELHALGHSLRAVEAGIVRQARVWTVTGTGASASGTLQLTGGAEGIEKVVMNMQSLELNSLGRGGIANAAVDPASFPELQFSIKNLVYDDAEFGAVEVQTKATPEGNVDITRLAVASELLSLQASGSWQGNANAQTSHVDLEVTDARMDELMDFFGYQESIEDGDLSGTLNAAWLGPPWAFTPAAAEGKVRVRVENGQLLDVEPGAAGRVLGLLSLSSLPRRLVLDFSDLFGEGFGFDTIEGGFILEDANAYTSDLVVDGPAARIEISGRVGIAAQDYDEVVTVTPYVKTGVSLIGSLAAGPAVGAALMVAESLLEKRAGPLNRIARKEYSVTGSWDDPVITRIDKPEAEAQPAEDTLDTE